MTDLGGIVFFLLSPPYLIDKLAISETKIGPRGCVYTEEVMKDGKPSRNYFQ